MTLITDKQVPQLLHIRYANAMVYSCVGDSRSASRYC